MNLGGTIFLTKYGNTSTLSDDQAAILLGANGIVIWVASESFDSITCDELNSHLYKMYCSTSILFVSTGITVIIVAGTKTANRFAAVADGEKVKLSGAPPKSTVNAVLEPTPEEFAMSAKRYEIKAIELERALCTSPPKWINKKDTKILGLNVDDEMAYVNTFLSNNGTNQCVGVIIDPNHEEALAYVLCVRCGAQINGNSALQSKRRWRTNYETPFGTGKCRSTINPQFSPASNRRLQETNACTRPLPTPVGNL